MSQSTLSPGHEERCVAEMTTRMAAAAHQMCRWVQEQERTLETMEKEVRPLIKDLGAGLLNELAHLQAPKYPPDTVACRCGQQATYQRQRAAQVLTLLRAIQVERPYYLCGHCHQGHAPLDRLLQICAGSISAGLEEALALLEDVLKGGGGDGVSWTTGEEDRQTVGTGRDDDELSNRSE